MFLSIVPSVLFVFLLPHGCFHITYDSVVSEDLYVLYGGWENKSTYPNWFAHINNAGVQGNSGIIAAAAIN